MNDLWPMITAHLERWQGADPFALTPGIQLLERGLGEVNAGSAPDPTRWARILTAGTGALARLIDLSDSSDAVIARSAKERAADLAPLLERMAGDATQRLSKVWRAS